MALAWDDGMGLNSDEKSELQKLLREAEWVQVGAGAQSDRWLLMGSDYETTDNDTERLHELLGAAGQYVS